MTQDEFKIKATELIRLMIDAIAEKEYTKLVSTIPPELSWATFDNAEPTPENACLGFGKWLDMQLAMWEDDYGKKFVVDHFNKSCMEEVDESDESRLETNNRTMISYNPASFGEELEFWFEIEFEVSDKTMSATFNVN